MQNVEFKAELRDAELARSICRAIGAREVGSFDQIDSYFRLPEARLKKRESPGEAPEWILYDRPNRAGSKLSTFHIYTEEEAVERYGSVEKRPWVVVRKRREVWMSGDVRIHLDEVEGLGSFLELEALICARQKRGEAEEAVVALRRSLSPALGEPVALGYSDMLAGAEPGGVR